MRSTCSRPGAAPEGQATLDQARSDLARYENLRAQKAIAEQTVTDQEFTVKQDEAQVKADQANIAQYELDLAYCHITAPVAGRVGLRLVDPGNYVTGRRAHRASSVITTMKPTTVRIHRRPERSRRGGRSASIAGAQAAGHRLYAATTRQKLATGTLYALSNQMTTSTGTVTLRATFANDDEALFPNEFVNIKLLVDTLHQGRAGADARGAERRARRLRLSGQRATADGVGAQGHARARATARTPPSLAGSRSATRS